eukprot:Hpha_TRINITY_DN12060_c0_g1::TRINITY_DN12060_c0_g1_i1::g.141029::m.141029
MNIPNIIRFFAEIRASASKDHFPSILLPAYLDLVSQSSSGTEEAVNAASNALALIARCRQVVHGMSWAGIMIRRADLRYSLFAECDLKSACFRECWLEASKFFRCDLNGASSIRSFHGSEVLSHSCMRPHWIAYPARYKRLFFSPDGTLVFIFIQTISNASEYVREGLVTKTGERLANDCEEAVRWDVAADKELPELSHPEGNVTGAAWSPTGLVIVTCGGSVLRVWEAPSRRELQDFHAEGAHSPVFSPDGSKLAVCCNAEVRLWRCSLSTTEFSQSGALMGHGSEVTCAAFAPDNVRLVSGGLDFTVRVWDVDSRQEIHRFRGHHHGLAEVLFSPDGRFVASTSGGRHKSGDKYAYVLKVYDTGVKSEIQSILDGSEYLNDLTPGELRLLKQYQKAAEWAGVTTVSPDRTKAIKVTKAGTKVVDVMSWGELYELENLRDNYVPEEKECETGLSAQTGTGHSADPPPPPPRRPEREYTHQTAAFSPDGAVVVSSKGPHISACAAETGHRLWELKLNDEQEECEWIGFSSDSRKVVLRAAQHVVVYDADSRAVIRIMKYRPGRQSWSSYGYGFYLCFFVFLPATLKLAVSDFSGTRVMNLQSGETEEFAIPKTPGDPRFPDFLLNKTVVLAGDADADRLVKMCKQQLKLQSIGFQTDAEGYGERLVTTKLSKEVASELWVWHWPAGSRPYPALFLSDARGSALLQMHFCKGTLLQADSDDVPLARCPSLIRTVPGQPMISVAGQESPEEDSESLPPHADEPLPHADEPLPHADEPLPHADEPLPHADEPL